MDNSGKKDACGMEKKMRDYGKIKMPKYFSTLAWMLLILKMGQYQTEFQDLMEFAISLLF